MNHPIWAGTSLPLPTMLARSTTRPTSGSVSRSSTARPMNHSYRNHPMTGQSRPWTAQSRPATARPQTAASTRHDASYVIALLEGRGISREVGMAALDKDTGRVMLVQVSRPQRRPLLVLELPPSSLQTARRMSRLCTRCICITRVLFLCPIRSCRRRTRPCCSPESARLPRPS